MEGADPTRRTSVETVDYLSDGLHDQPTDRSSIERGSAVAEKIQAGDTVIYSHAGGAGSGVVESVGGGIATVYDEGAGRSFEVPMNRLRKA
jgi:hypothetical protein